MKKEVAEKWVKALRSGEYKQGRGALKNERNEYCCLGVLTDLVKAEVNLEWSGNTPFINNERKSSRVLTHEVTEYSGIKHCMGKFGPKSHDALWFLNDDIKYKKTFVEIVDIIEKEWEQL